MTTQRTDELLILLQDAGLDFVVVGGVAAIAHGSLLYINHIEAFAHDPRTKCSEPRTFRPFTTSVNCVKNRIGLDSYPKSKTMSRT